MQRSPGIRSWTGPLERPWKSWITSFLIASLVKRFNARVGVSFDELIGTGHQMPRASDRPRDLKKNTKTWRLLLPQSQITVACSESNSSDSVLHLRFVTVIKSLCYFDDLFCFFAACYKILFTKLSFFFKFRNSSSSRGRDGHNGPSGVTNEEQRTWNTHTANLDNYDACGFRLLIEIWKNVLTQSWPSLRWISVCDVKNRRNSGTHVPSDGRQNRLT